MDRNKGEIMKKEELGLDITQSPLFKPFRELSEVSHKKLKVIGREFCEYLVRESSGGGQWAACKPKSSHTTRMIPEFTLGAIYRISPSYFEVRAPAMPVVEPKKVYQEKFIASNPACIYIDTDGVKTTVKCSDGDTFDPVKGCMLAYYKRHHPKMTARQMSELLEQIQDGADRPKKKKPMVPANNEVGIRIQCDSKSEPVALEAIASLFK